MTIVARFASATTAGLVHTIARERDGSFTCSCRAFLYHAGKDCKHLIAFKADADPVPLRAPVRTRSARDVLTISAATVAVPTSESS